MKDGRVKFSVKVCQVSGVRLQITGYRLQSDEGSYLKCALHRPFRYTKHYSICPPHLQLRLEEALVRERFFSGPLDGVREAVEGAVRVRVVVAMERNIPERFNDVQSVKVSGVRSPLGEYVHFLRCEYFATLDII